MDNLSAEAHTVIMEYNPTQQTQHLYFTWDDKPVSSPDWINLGEYTGTGIQIEKELERRIRAYKRKNRAS